MKQEEYIAAIRKQQGLIRRLFSNRKRRSEVIEEVTKERYKHLQGRFFRPKGEHFINAASDVDYYIVGVSTDSLCYEKDTVRVLLDCRYICRTWGSFGDGRGIDGISVLSQSFVVEPHDNLDEILADKWVPTEKAVSTIDEYYRQMMNNLMKKH